MAGLPPDFIALENALTTCSRELVRFRNLPLGGNQALLDAIERLDRRVTRNMDGMTRNMEMLDRNMGALDRNMGALERNMGAMETRLGDRIIELGARIETGLLLDVARDHNVQAKSQNNLVVETNDNLTPFHGVNVQNMNGINQPIVGFPLTGLELNALTDENIRRILSELTIPNQGGAVDIRRTLRLAIRIKTTF